MRIERGVVLRMAICVVVGGGWICSASSSGAQDGDGLGGFLRFLSPPEPAVPRYVPEVYGSPPHLATPYRSRRSFRLDRRDRGPRVLAAAVVAKRHTSRSSLPQASKKPAVGDAAAAALAKAGEVDAALLHDATLRRGDIVVTTHGAFVFGGGSTGVHRASDFRAVEEARGLGKGMRGRLVAMTSPRNLYSAATWTSPRAASSLIVASHPVSERTSNSIQPRVVYPSNIPRSQVVVKLEPRGM